MLNLKVNTLFSNELRNFIYFEQTLAYFTYHNVITVVKNFFCILTGNSNIFINHLAKKFFTIFGKTCFFYKYSF